MLNSRGLSKNSRVLINWPNHFLQTDGLDVGHLGNESRSRLLRFVSNKRHVCICLSMGWWAKRRGGVCVGVCVRHLLSRRLLEASEVSEKGGQFLGWPIFSTIMVALA